jgi:DNA-binding transcriptional LysR family regulator
MYDWAELRHFRYLLAILEKQGFRVAADELHTSQPNLTVQARQFQENASVRLFRKMKNGRIRPTETGVAFITLARFLLETRDEVIEALIAIERGEIHTTRFGCCSLVDQDLFRGFCAMHKEILPSCFVRPTHGDTSQLAEEVAAGAVDAAIITLPLNHSELRVEEIRRDRLVACLRRDNPLARKAALRASDLRNNLTVMYHPQRHPEAHERLLERLDNAGIKIEEYSRASNPSEMQTLIKEGYGFAMVREGSIIDSELTTRPIADMDWTTDTAVIYHKERHPKTVPVLVRNFKRQVSFGGKESRSDSTLTSMNPRRRAPRPTANDHVQLDLLSGGH